MPVDSFFHEMWLQCKRRTPPQLIVDLGLHGRFANLEDFADVISVSQCFYIQEKWMHGSITFMGQLSSNCDKMRWNSHIAYTYICLVVAHEVMILDCSRKTLEDEGANLRVCVWQWKVSPLENECFVCENSTAKQWTVFAAHYLLSGRWYLMSRKCASGVSPVGFWNTYFEHNLNVL